jgi:DNA-binding HxlR family transcriptional regulator
VAKRARRNPDSPCRVGEAIGIVGGRWKGEILWFVKDGPRRFMELRRLLPAISPKVLTQELRDLERDGLVHREHHAEIPPRVEYSMTPLGRSALPMLATIAEWWRQSEPAVRRAAAKRRPGA